MKGPHGFLVVSLCLAGFIAGCPKQATDAVSSPDTSGTAKGIQPIPMSDARATIRLNANASSPIVLDADDNLTQTNVKLFGSPRNAVGEFRTLGLSITDRPSGKWVLLTGITSQGLFKNLFLSDGSSSTREGLLVGQDEADAAAVLIPYARGDVQDPDLLDAANPVLLGLLSTVPTKLEFLEPGWLEFAQAIQAATGQQDPNPGMAKVYRPPQQNFVGWIIGGAILEGTCLAIPDCAQRQKQWYEENIEKPLIELKQRIVEKIHEGFSTPDTSSANNGATCSSQQYSQYTSAFSQAVMQGMALGQACVTGSGSACLGFVEKVNEANSIWQQGFRDCVPAEQRALFEGQLEQMQSMLASAGQSSLPQNPQSPDELTSNEPDTPKVDGPRSKDPTYYVKTGDNQGIQLTQAEYESFKNGDFVDLTGRDVVYVGGEGLDAGNSFIGFGG